MPDAFSLLESLPSCRYRPKCIQPLVSNNTQADSFALLVQVWHPVPFVFLNIEPVAPLLETIRPPSNAEHVSAVVYSAKVNPWAFHHSSMRELLSC